MRLDLTIDEMKLCVNTQKLYSKAASHGNETRTMDFVSLNGLGVVFFSEAVVVGVLLLCCNLMGE